MTIQPNPSIVAPALVPIYGTPVLNPDTGEMEAPITGYEDGLFWAVQQQCLGQFPDLAQYVVSGDGIPADCGPNGVWLHAADQAAFLAAAPIAGSQWDLFVDKQDDPAP